MAADDVEVTEENFGELLVRALTEARAIAEGGADATRRVRRPLATRSTAGKPSHVNGAETE
jgi:hypothetical protein